MSRLSAIVASTDDLEHEDIKVPQWGNTVFRVSSMNLANRGKYLEGIIKAREEGNDLALAQINAELVVNCTFDPDDGSKVFEESDIPMLLTKHGGAVARLANKASTLSGLDAEADERLGKDYLASSETPSDDSSSSLPVS